MQFGEDCRVPVRLEIHLIAANVAVDKTGSGQLLQLPLNSADGTADVPDQLAEVVRLISMAEQPSEYASPRATEQEGCRIESRRSCSQDGDNRTQNGDARSTVKRELALSRARQLVIPCRDTIIHAVFDHSKRDCLNTFERW